MSFPIINHDFPKFLLVYQRETNIHVLWKYPYGIIYEIDMYLGKLQYFTNLKCSAIKGDNSPYQPSSTVRSLVEVVIKFTQMYMYTWIMNRSDQWDAGP